MKNQHLLIIVSAAVIAAISITLVYFNVSKNNQKAGSASDDGSTTFEQEAGSEDATPPFFEANLRIGVCPGGSGSIKNPVTAVRGGSETSIPLCVSSTNTSTQVWHLKARGLIQEEIDGGIHIRFENETITLAGLKGSDDFSLDREIKENTAAIVSADNNAEPGVHGIIVVAVLSMGENRVTSITTQIYVDVKS